ncbi:MAG: glycosyltransferase family 2 protein [Cyclobacteriaceae bacterium]
MIRDTSLADTSVFIPILNEVNHLDTLLSSLIDGKDYEATEFFLIDGGSTDGTMDLIKAWQTKHPFIYLLDNPKQYANFAFNHAFPLSKGKYIAFIGAHAEYPPNYFESGKKYLDANECDVVGGPLIQKGRSVKGKAIAFAMSSRLGVGNTEFRTSQEKQFVDSVAFAMYKREIFNDVGLLDEELIRNQDDELHYRMNAAGYRILMVPEMKCVYYVRETLSGLFKQYFQYGLFKPLVLKKVRSGVRMRHLIPAGFVLFFLLLPLSWLFMEWLALVPLLTYLVLLLATAIGSDLKIKSKIYLLLVYPVLHISYGIGFLFGLRKLLK